MYVPEESEKHLVYNGVRLLTDKLCWTGLHIERSGKYPPLQVQGTNLHESSNCRFILKIETIHYPQHTICFLLYKTTGIPSI